MRDVKRVYNSLKYNTLGMKKANYKLDTGLKSITVQVCNLHSTCI
jgi:hypothetical protein